MPSWVVCGSLILSCGYRAVPEFFLVGILWVSNFFLVGISSVPNFFLWVFHGSPIFCGYFVGSKFSLVGNFVFSCVCRMRKGSTEIYLKLYILFQIYSFMEYFSLVILCKYPVFIMFCLFLQQSTSSSLWPICN